MQLLNIIQGTEEWKSLRKNKITATDIPKIMGVSPWDTARTLWLKKKGLMPEQKVTSVMLAGADIEPKIRDMCNARLDMFFTQMVGLHDKYEWAMASFDGINQPDRCVLEIKLANKADHAMALSGKIPEKYYPQVQWQLFVSGYDVGYYASYHQATDDLVIVEVEANKIAIETYIEAAKKFREQDAEPEAGEDDVIIHDKEFMWIMLADDLRIDEMAAKEAELNLKKSKEKLIEYVKEKELDHVHRHKGADVEMTYVTRSGSIKYDSIPEVKTILENIDVDQYRGKETGYWKFSVKGD